MWKFNRIGRKTAVGAVGAVLALGAGGTAYAATASSGSSPTVAAQAATSTTPTSPTTVVKGRRHRGLLERTDHATAELKVHGNWVTYTLDRGKVSAVSATSISVLRPDGQTATESINSSTKFKGVGSESAVQLNRPVAVISDNGVALQVRQRAASSSTGTGATPSTSVG